MGVRKRRIELRGALEGIRRAGPILLLRADEPELIVRKERLGSGRSGLIGGIEGRSDIPIDERRGRSGDQLPDFVPGRFELRQLRFRLIGPAELHKTLHGEICVGRIRGAELPLLRDRLERLFMLAGFEQGARCRRLSEAGG